MLSAQAALANSPQNRSTGHEGLLMIGANRVAATGRAEYPEPDDLRGVTRLAEPLPAPRNRRSSALSPREVGETRVAFSDACAYGLHPKFA
jgi:hypothetical protein